MEGFVKWPKSFLEWVENGVLHISASFTWHLPLVKERLAQRGFWWNKAIVGGPAVGLMPNYFDDLDFVEIGSYYPGVLQKLNPMATRTTLGCPRKCKFCGVGAGKIEQGPFQELTDWYDAPILCDNNILAASMEHFDRVIDRLKPHGWCDFNQGLDARLLTEYHCKRIAEIKNPFVRLACDDASVYPYWDRAWDWLRTYGVAAKNIKSLVLIAFNTGPDECWNRCKWVSDHKGGGASPMWFHRLDCMKRGEVTEAQKKLGWTNEERERIMIYFYGNSGLAPYDDPEAEDFDVRVIKVKRRIVAEIGHMFRPT